MTQPDYVPVSTASQVRPDEELPVPRAWRADRPSDEANAVVPAGRRFGHTGPDLGYGLKLAKRFEPRLALAGSDSVDDAVAGCFAVGSRRASSFGRAPVVYDMEFAYTLWGLLGGGPPDLIALRSPLFRGAAHDYWIQRSIADRVKEDALRLTPVQVRDRLAEWRSLIVE
jgi:hypothetical protein